MKPDTASTAPRSTRTSPARAAPKSLPAPSGSADASPSFRVEPRHVGLLAAGALVLGGAWFATTSAEAKIRREEQLIYSGTEIRDAIASYYFAAAPGKRELPRDMQDLIDDTRDGSHRRHLSRLVKDPVTGSEDWVVVWTPDHRMAGVHSASEDAPVGRHDFDRDAVQVGGTRHYSQWVFRFDPGPFGPADEALRTPVSPPSGSGSVERPGNRARDDSAAVPRLAPSVRLSYEATARHSLPGMPSEAGARLKSHNGSVRRIDRSDPETHLARSAAVGTASLRGAPAHGVVAGEPPAGRKHAGGMQDARGRSADRVVADLEPTRALRGKQNGLRVAASSTAEPATESSSASADAASRGSDATPVIAESMARATGASVVGDDRRETPIVLKLAIPEWLLPARVEPYGSVAVGTPVHSGSPTGENSGRAAARVAVPESDPRTAADTLSGASAAPQFVGTAALTGQRADLPEKSIPPEAARGPTGSESSEPRTETSVSVETAVQAGPFGSEADSGQPVAASRPHRGRPHARAVGTGASAGVMPASVQAMNVSSVAGGASAGSGDAGPTADEIAQARQVACDLLSASDQESCARAASEGNGGALPDCLRSAADRFDRCSRGEPPAGVAAQ